MSSYEIMPARDAEKCIFCGKQVRVWVGGVPVLNSTCATVEKAAKCPLLDDCYSQLHVGIQMGQLFREDRLQEIRHLYAGS